MTLQKNTLEMIAAVNQAIQEEGKLSINRVKYILLSKGLIKLTKYVYVGVSKRMVKWRNLGLINWKDIIDKRTIDIRPTTFSDFDEAYTWLKGFYQTDSYQHQDNHVLVIIEKDTMTKDYEDYCRELHVPLIVSGGFTSYTRKKLLMEEIENTDKPVIIIYAGDWDAEGLYIEQILKDKFGSKVTFKRICMVESDIRKYKDIFIEWNPKEKHKEKRYVQDYLGKHGNKKWEIELISGNEQTRRLKEVLNEVISLRVVKESVAADRKEIKEWEKVNLK